MTTDKSAVAVEQVDIDAVRQLPNWLTKSSVVTIDVLRDAFARHRLTSANPARMEALERIFETGNGASRLTPRIIDIAFTAFMAAKGTNDDDGGPTDWFTDTKPNIDALIAKMRDSLAIRALQTKGGTAGQ